MSEEIIKELKEKTSELLLSKDELLFKYVDQILQGIFGSSDEYDNILVASGAIEQASSLLSQLSLILNNYHVDRRVKKAKLKVTNGSKEELLLDMAGLWCKMEVCELDCTETAMNNKMKYRECLDSLVEIYKDAGGVVLEYLLYVDADNNDVNITALYEDLEKALSNMLDTHLRINKAEDGLTLHVSQNKREAVIDYLIGTGVSELSVLEIDKPIVANMNSYIDAISYLARNKQDELVTQD